MKHWSAVVLLALLAMPRLTAQQVPDKPGPLISSRELDYDPINPVRIGQWISAAGRHHPGEADDEASSIADWNSGTLAVTLSDVTGLLDLRRELCDKRIFIERPFRRSKFSINSINAIFGLRSDECDPLAANPILERGALLHTDIAMLVPVKTGSRGGIGQQTQIHQADGQVVDSHSNADHWRCARFLIEALAPRPSQSEFARAWYRATTAHQASGRHFADAQPNLASALRLFPADPQLLLYAGVMHETFATDDIQSSAQDLVRAGVFEGVVIKRSELTLAESLMRRAVQADNRLGEAHLRLGRVLGLEGRHVEAIRELVAAKSLTADRLLQYYDALFLALEQSATEDVAAARSSLDAAAALYPGVSSLLMAQSHLARSTGDLAGARASLDALLSHPMNSRPDDPWLQYDESDVRDAEALMSSMRLTVSPVVAR